jgi:excisionase family DNA binding protein
MVAGGTVHYLSTAEVADILNVDRETIQNEVKRRRIKAIKVGKLFRIHPDALQEYLTKNSTGGRGHVHSPYHTEEQQHKVTSWPL